MNGCSGYRFCEFNLEGNLYAVRKYVNDEEQDLPEKDQVIHYEAVIIDLAPGSIEIS